MNYFTRPRLKSEVKIFSILGLLLLIFCSVSAVAQNPLDPAKKFNLFLQGNATLSGNESEGPIVIGGNLTIAGGHQVNVNGANYNNLFTIGGIKIGLAVRGGVTYNSGTLQVNGQSYAKIGNCASPQASVASGSGGIAEVSPSGNPGATPRILINTGQPPATVCDNIFGNGTDKIDVDAAFVSFKQCSPSFGTKTNNVAIGDQNGNAIPGLVVDGTGYYSDASLVQNNPKITLDPNAINVLNVTGDFWTALGSNINFQNVPQSGSGALIINFKTGSTYNFVMPSNGGTNGGTAPYTLFNFPNATTLSIGGNELNGSVFAPFADITHIGTNNIQGQVIGQTYTSSGEELHQYPFVPNLGSCGNTPPVCNAPKPTGTGAARCGEGTLNLTAAGCTTGFTAKWFTDAAGNSAAPGSNSGNSYTTPNISATTDYYVLCQEDAKQTCKSATTKVTATINAKPTISVTTTTCNQAGTQFEVIYTASSGATISADKGNLDAANNKITGINSGETVTITATANGCEEKITATKTCTIPCNPPTPTGIGAKRCGEGSVTLTANGCDATYTPFWFSDNNLSNQVATGSSFVTPSISTTTTYYVVCMRDQNCKSPVVNVVATINAKPTISVTTTTCNQAGTQFEVIYTASSGATITTDKGNLDAANNKITGVTSGETVTITATANGCEEKITATKTCTIPCNPPTPTGTGAARCGEGTLNLTASGCTTGFTAKWFTDAAGNSAAPGNNSGNSYTTPNISATTDYYVLCQDDAQASCKSPTTKVTATVAQKPTLSANPTVTQATCKADGSSANNDAKIVISGIANGSTYTVDGGGSQTLSGNTISLENLANPSASKTYVIKIFNSSATDCFLEVTAVLEPKVCTPTCTPPSPTGQGTTICANTSATISATGCDATYVLKWYSNADLSSEITAGVSGNNLTTPTLNSTTDYYAACVKSADCKSAGVKITVTVAPKPTITGSPTVTQATCKADGSSANSDAKIVISGITNGSTYTVNGGSSQNLSGATTITLDNLPNPGAPIIYSIKIFNAAATECFLEVFAPLDPKICTPNCTPPSPSGQGTSICLNSTATISATGCDQTYLLKWYSDAALNNEITTGLSGNNLTTPTLNSTTDYYAACVKSADCKSAGVKITVVVKTAKPVFSSLITRCPSDESTYSVSTNSNGVVTVKSPSSAQISGNSPYIITNVQAGQNLTLTTTLDGCSKDTTIIAPNCGCVPQNPSALAANVGICEGDEKPNPTFTAFVGQNTAVDWYDAVTGGNLLLANSLTFTAPAPGTYYIQARSTATGCANDVNQVRTPVTFAISPKPVFKIVPKDPTCLNGVAQNDGKVTLTEGTVGQKYAFNTTGFGTLPTTAATATTIAAIPATIVGNSPNNAPSTTYFVRVFSNEGCFRDTSVTVKGLICEVICTKPTRQIKVTDPNCTQAGKIELVSVSNGDKYGIANGTTYSVPAYASALNVPTTLPAVIKNNINFAADSVYTIRVFNGKDNCFTDTTVTVKAAPGPKPNAGGDLTLACRNNVQQSGTTLSGFSPAGGTWSALTNPASATVTNDGVVSGMTAIGTYSFVYSFKGCSDTLNVTVQGCGNNCPPTKPNFVVSSATICEKEAIPVFQAISVESNTSVFWYASATGGAPIASDTAKYKPTVSAIGTYVYYAAVAYKSGACADTSARTPATLVIKDCSADLSLKKTVDKKVVAIGEIVTFTIKVLNDLQVAATGVTVKDTINTLAFAPVAGSATTNSGSVSIDGQGVLTWNGNFAATKDSVVITFKAKVIADGVHFNKAQITTMNEKDVDSTPGNDKDGEDDIDRVCISVPMIFCSNETISVDIAAPAGFTGYQWFRADSETATPVLISGQNTNKITVTQVGFYSFIVTGGALGSCNGTNCCPVIIKVKDCGCPPPVCVPFVIQKKVKRLQ